MRKTLVSFKPHSLPMGWTALLVAALFVLTERPSFGRCPDYVGRRDKVPPAQNPNFVHSYAVGDFNGDGLADAVLGHVKFNQDVKFQPEILLNDGNGGFFDGTTQVITGPIPTLWHPREMVVADFNGDGKDDIFIAAHGIDSLAKGEPNKLLLSTPGNNLVDASDRIPQVNDFSHAAAAGDIDGDGDIDIVVGNLGGEFQGPYILINDGTGTFTMDTSRLPQKEFCCDGNMGAVLLFDVNKDGDIDLIIGDHFRDVSRLYLNDGNGFFQDSARIDLPPSFIGSPLVHTVDIQAADVNGDGNIDLILSQVGGRGAVNYLGRKIQILMGDGTGQFTDETSARIPSAFLPPIREEWYLFLHIVDFNRDGFPDIVVSIAITGGPQPPPDTPYVFLNDGQGNFSPLPATVIGPGYLGPLIPIDVHGDGDLDFLNAGFLYELFESVKSVICVDASSLPTGEVGVAYTTRLVNGGLPPYTFTLTKGTFPAGLTPDTADGRLTGTPTLAKRGSFTVRITDQLGASVMGIFKMTILKALGITTTALKAGLNGKAYKGALKAKGGLKPYTWSLVSGNLPTGLTLNSLTGAITGIPTQTGTFDPTFQVTDPLGGSGQRSFTLTIN